MTDPARCCSGCATTYDGRRCLRQRLRICGSAWSSCRDLAHIGNKHIRSRPNSDEFGQAMVELRRNPADIAQIWPSSCRIPPTSGRIQTSLPTLGYVPRGSAGIYAWESLCIRQRRWRQGPSNSPNFARPIPAGTFTLRLCNLVGGPGTPTCEVGVAQSAFRNEVQTLGLQADFLTQIGPTPASNCPKFGPIRFEFASS